MAKTVEEIEKAIASLPKSDLKKFRAWYEKFDSELWDKQICCDSESGKLDKIAEKALEEYRAGKARKL